jgi:hypothetical protein
VKLADQYTATFDHAHESGAPGDYRVTLNPGAGDSIQTELTATPRTGIARFTFPKSGSGSVLINSSGSAMGALDASVQIDSARHELAGSVTSGQFCYQRNRYKLYFVARFDQPFASFGTWTGPLLVPGSTSASDTIGTDPFVYQPIPGGPTGIAGGGTTAQTGGYATFDTKPHPVVEARIGVSSVSIAGARANLDAEAGTKSFDTLRTAARATWDKALGRIRVRGGSQRNARLVYTSLYHALLHPGTYSDVDGRYTGFDGQVQSAGLACPLCRHLRLGHLPHADAAAVDAVPQAGIRHRGIAAGRSQRERCAAQVVTGQRPHARDDRGSSGPAARLELGVRGPRVRLRGGAEGDGQGRRSKATDPSSPSCSACSIRPIRNSRSSRPERARSRPGSFAPRRSGGPSKECSPHPRPGCVGSSFCTTRDSRAMALPLPRRRRDEPQRDRLGDGAGVCRAVSIGRPDSVPASDQTHHAPGAFSRRPRPQARARRPPA